MVNLSLEFFSMIVDFPHGMLTIHLYKHGENENIKYLVSEHCANLTVRLYNSVNFLQMRYQNLSDSFLYSSRCTFMIYRSSKPSYVFQICSNFLGDPAFSAERI